MINIKSKSIAALLVFLFLGLGFSAKAQTLISSSSKATFVIKNAGISVDGKFGAPEGSIRFDPSALSSSSFKISIATKTIDTDNSTRDKHLRKDDYFDVEKYPQMTFNSSGITKKGDKYIVEGKLKIKKTEKTFKIPFTVSESGGVYTFNANFELDRRDFGVGGYSFIMSDDVKVKITLKAEK